MKKILSVVFALFLLVPMLVPSVRAFNMTIAPSKKVFELNRGETREYQIMFRNDLATATYLARIVDFVYNDLGERKYLEKENVSDLNQSLMSWVQLDPEQFLAQKGIDTTITVRISVPKDAAFGDHYGVILIEKPSVEGEGSGPVSVGGSIASVLAIKVLGGDSVKAGSLVDYLISTRERARNTVSFEVSFRNSGNEFYGVLAEIEVFALPGDPTPIKVLTREFTVFPNAVREVKIPLGDLGENFEEGDYFSKLTISEYYKGAKVSVMGQDEKSFHYYLPLGDGEVVDPTTETGFSSDLMTVIRELGWYIAGFILVLVVLIRVLFSQKRKK